MSILAVNRRHFLQGAGGFLLALPLLPSLLPKKAQAQAATVPPRFVAMATQHGAIWGPRMYPDDSTLTERTNLYAGHAIRRGTLALNSDGGNSSLSPVLTASSGLLTSGLVEKINVIRGLDIPFYLGHHTGGHLGNFARNDGNGAAGVRVQSQPRRTIDQVMAQSSSFYADLSTNRARSVNIGTGGARSISWTRNASGGIEPVGTSNSSAELFNTIYVPPPDDEVDPRVPVVDRVYESYKRLADGAFGDARRLSKADRDRLRDHMDRVSELQRKLNVVASCGDVSPPAIQVNNSTMSNPFDVGAMRTFYQTHNDVIVTAFVCGTTRIATINTWETWSSYAGDWHNDIAHKADQAEGSAQRTIDDAHQAFFESVFIDLIAKLDVEEVEGKTFLDNSLVMWTQESGTVTHDPIGIPVITGGSASGFLRTGNYIDYRNRDNRNLIGTSPANENMNPGILYTQWLATVLQAMGVPPSEFEVDGEKGYGLTYRDPDYYGRGRGASSWPDQLFRDASDIVPFLKA